MKRIILSLIAALALGSLNGCFADVGPYAVGGAAPVYVDPAYGYGYGPAYYSTPTYVNAPAYVARPATRYYHSPRTVYRPTAPVYVAPRAAVPVGAVVHQAPPPRRWR